MRRRGTSWTKVRLTSWVAATAVSVLLSGAAFGAWAPRTQAIRAADPAISAGAGPVWTNITRHFAPPARTLGAMTYDGQDRFVLLFGGYAAHALNDSWAFFNGAWHKISTTSSPTARRGMAMAYDPIDRYVLLFGGTPGTNNNGLNDTWTFRGGNWTQLHPPTSPSGRVAASLVYDPARQAMVLFGGTSDYRCGCSVSGNEWSFVHGNWTRVNAKHLPTLTLYTSGISFDRPLLETVVFGGWDPGLFSTVNTTYVLQADRWSAVTTPVNLTARQGVLMVYDPQQGATVLYGGDTTAGGVLNAQNETWSFTSGGWAQYRLTSGPPPVAFGMIAFDSANDHVLIFGGQTGPGSGPQLFGQTWLFG